jgi:proteic killer suppression protein
VDITFDNTRLEKLINDTKQLQKEFGIVMADIIRLRMDDLSSVKTLEDVRNLPGKYHELTSDRKGQIATHLKQPKRLIFVPDHDPIPINEGGGMDWKKINRIKIIEITDYHGK